MERKPDWKVFRNIPSCCGREGWRSRPRTVTIDSQDSIYLFDVMYDVRSYNCSLASDRIPRSRCGRSAERNVFHILRFACLLLLRSTMELRAPLFALGWGPLCLCAGDGLRFVAVARWRERGGGLRQRWIRSTVGLDRRTDDGLTGRPAHSLHVCNGLAGGRSTCRSTEGINLRSQIKCRSIYNTVRNQVPFVYSYRTVPVGRSPYHPITAATAPASSSWPPTSSRGTYR